MSWEVPIMRSRTSCFEWGLSKDLLRRRWPLWAAYLLACLLCLPNLGTVARWTDAANAFGTINGWGEPNVLLLQSGVGMTVLSFFACFFSAWAHFGYLFDTRGSGLMGSLPVRRESCFVTLWLTGLVPMLLIEALAGLICWAQLAGAGLRFGTVGTWLLMRLCADLLFYGLAVLAAMLTGSRVLFPLLYLILNFGASALSACVYALLEWLLYGYFYSSFALLNWLSPPVVLINALDISLDPTVHVEGLGTLIAYGGVGLVLSALALLAYRRRHLETATDAISQPWLRRVFPYVLGLCGAFLLLMLGCAIGLVFLGGRDSEGQSFPKALIALLLGAFLGYFAARMLLKKSVRAFRGSWLGYGVLALCLTLFLATAFFDLTGFEKRVPEAGRVESATISGSYYIPELREEESLRLLQQVHQSYVDHQEDLEDVVGTFFQLEYRLKDGGSLRREYKVPMRPGEEHRETLRALQALLNCPEALLARNERKLPAEEQISHIQLQVTWYAQTGDAHTTEIYVPREDARAFLREAVAPDAREGHLGRIWLLDDEDYPAQTSNVSILFYLAPDGSETRDAYGIPSTGASDLAVDKWEITMDARRCLDWLAQHTEIQTCSLEDARLHRGQLPFRENGRI